MQRTAFVVPRNSLKFIMLIDPGRDIVEHARAVCNTGNQTFTGDS